MSLNRYTTIPARQTATVLPKSKGTTTDENQNTQNVIRPKATAVAATTRTTRLPLSNISNQQQAAGRDRATIRPTKATAVPVQTKVPAKAEPESELTDELVQEPKQTLKRPSSVLEQVLPAGRDTIQTRSLTRSKRRRSEVMEIEEEKQAEWIDIDEEDRNDPQMVADYVNDVYEYLREKEKLDVISPRYITKQLDINEKMRGVLVDWLVEVHRTFKLVSETLFLTVNILDRFLEVTAVSRDRLQLVGVTCMLISAKYQEIYAPEDFVYISDSAYEKSQILECEEQILSSLEFRLTTPSLLDFLRRFSKAAQSDPIVHTLGKYIIEVTMMDLKLYRYLPSELAAAAVYIARAMTHQNPVWTPTLTHYTKYSESEARSVAIVVNTLLKRLAKSPYKAIKKKYSSQKFGEVATIPLVNDL